MNREYEYGLPSQRGGRAAVCGTCVHHRRADAVQGEEWICFCDTSEYYLDETGYDHYCVDHEPRAGRRF